MANSADPDQLASEEANWSGSTLFRKAGHIQVQQNQGWYHNDFSTCCGSMIPITIYFASLQYKKKVITKYLFKEGYLFGDKSNITFVI